MINTEKIKDSILQEQSKVRTIELYGTFWNDEIQEELDGVIIDFDPPLVDDKGNELVYILQDENADDFRKMIETLINNKGLAEALNED
jgi:hypothetical protein